MNSSLAASWSRAAAILTAILVPAGEAAAIDVARGIYALGAARNNANTPQDDRLSGIRDYDFVSGFTLRVFWSDIETSQGQYNFDVIDQAVQSVAANGQGLSLEILNGEEPAYVLSGASATYIDHRGGTNPVPWDPFAQQRMAALLDALANHTVVGPGGPHLLRDDPTLLAIDSAPAGLNFGVRDINNGIRSHPQYTQQGYIDAVVDGVAASAAAFPNDTNFLAFFGFTDGQPGVPVDKQIIQQLSPHYNGPGQPKLDFFVENLSDNGPLPLLNGAGVGNNLADWVATGGDTMVQALDSWLQHSPDREPQLASHNPATGIELACNAYGTRFFELYIADLDGAISGTLDAAGRSILADLRAWNAVLTSPITRPGDYNTDGTVDAADYVLWRKQLGSDFPLPNDGTSGVDPADIDRWITHYGESAESFEASRFTQAATTPEPSSAILLALAAAIVRCNRQFPKLFVPRNRIPHDRPPTAAPFSESKKEVGQPKN